MSDSWHQRNVVHLATYYADYRERIRFEMVKAYGGECLHCGEADPIVLVLDHIHDDAPTYRAVNKNTAHGFKLYQKLKRLGWPNDNHQLLCHNCNFRKEYTRRKDAVKKRCAS